MRAPDGESDLEIVGTDSAMRRRCRESRQALGLPRDLDPLVCVTQDDAGNRQLYQRMEIGPAGYLYTRVTTLERGESDALDGASLAEVARGFGQKRIAAFNPGFNHTRWKPGVELERKFTMALDFDCQEASVDIWRLHRDLNRELRLGAWSGYIPEFNQEYHVWDYESAMFEVLEPAHAKGYIAFIPQADGRATVKYKRFVTDAEQRLEDISNDIAVEPAQFMDAARRLSGGQVRRLPGFRRTRFDCDLESLETGNVFGIFFDICRTGDGTKALLSQCEVEYLRSRTLAPVAHVEEEFVKLCDRTRDFLAARGIEANEGHYSKLSFTRDVAARWTSRAGVA